MILKEIQLLKFFILFTTTLFIFNANSQKRDPLDEPYIPGQLIIQLAENVTIDDVINQLPDQYRFNVDRELSKTMRAWLIEFDTDEVEQMTALSLVNRLQDVSIVQNNHLVEIRSNVPNDPNYNNQWHHRNDVSASIQSEDAWGFTTGGKNAFGDDIVVCILEQVDFSHNDLNANHWVNTGEIPGNGIDDDGNGYVDDINGWNVGNNSGNLPTNQSGHGTSVAGMIGAVGNNNIGVAGANWDVKMMNVVGYNINSEASVVAAYEYPLVQRKIYNETNGEKGAFVVSTNASWGIDGANPDNYPIWCAFYDSLGNEGILNCGATTNQNLDVDVAGDMPTACASKFMVGVGRSSSSESFAGGYGATTVNFVAPGINVYTTANNNSYTTTTGTSFSSPLTAGVVALLYSIPCPFFMNIVMNNPKEGAEIVFDALMNGTDVRPAYEGRFITNGRLNAANSINILADSYCGECIPPLELMIHDADESSITVSYSRNPETEEYEIYYKEINDDAYNSILSSDTSATVTGLKTCSIYEVFVSSYCEDDEELRTTDTIMVNTLGCGTCIDEDYCPSRAINKRTGVYIYTPSSIEAEITNYISTSDWGKPVHEGHVFGEFILVGNGSALSERACNEIDNANEVNGNIAVAVNGSCNYVTKANNAQNAGATALLIINDRATSPPELTGFSEDINIPVLMISQQDGAELLAVLRNGSEKVEGLIGLQREWIESFRIGTTTFNTGDDNGYRHPFFSDSSASHLHLARNIDYDFNIKPAFGGTELEEYARIWIDFNKDGVFDENELVYDVENAKIGEFNGTFKIPLEADTGSTRLRVQMVYQGTGSDSIPSVCDNFYHGEVEDYCITIRVLNTQDEDEEDIIIFPNPAYETLSFESANDQIYELIMEDPAGNIVMEKTISSYLNQVDVSQLSAGTYFCRFTDKEMNTVIMKKVLIVK